MIKEAIQEIVNLSKPTVQEFDGLTYTNRTFIPVKGPMLEGENVTTLSGLVELVRAKLNGLDVARAYALVESPTRVTVSMLLCNVWGDRQTHIACELPSYGAFPFGRYMEQEEFMIGLQAFFVRGEEEKDSSYVVEIAGKLTASDVKQSNDDGISQNVVIKKGPVLQADVVVKKLVKLRPYRTFREIVQPASEFVFRMRSRQNEVPALALHVADAEMWQPEAMRTIKAFIEKELPDLTVVA